MMCAVLLGSCVIYMQTTIVDAFEMLRSTGGASGTIAQFIETQDDDPGTKVFWARYYQAVDELRAAWGEPIYEGIGARAGYRGTAPDAIRGVTYANALRFAWWRTGFGEAGILLTGHDADTLLFLTIAVSGGVDPVS